MTENWREEVNEDVGLIGYYLSEAERSSDDEARAKHFAMARREALSVARDIEAIAEDVYSIHKAELDGAASGA